MVLSLALNLRLNYNYYAPRFDLDSYEFSFSTLLPCGAFVGRLTAFDLDLVDRLTFKVVSGDAEDDFRLDKYTGVLRCSPKCRRQFTRQKYYLLNVSVGVM